MYEGNEPPIPLFFSLLSVVELTSSCLVKLLEKIALTPAK